ncbi:MAG TPA: exopolysaccharide biosynthesis protein [Microbacteriaceae bacterium]|nr:exopolysaccharide biosynthesis protein [Microbacteriaceae bacterium]
MASRVPHIPDLLRPLLESAALAHVVLVAGLGLVLANPFWRAMIGEAGYTSALVCLASIAALSARARAQAIDWTNALPLSLALYLGWAVLSLTWSYQPLDTLWRLGNLLATALLGLAIAWTRDTIQIVRGLGDVLRVLLVGSLVVELVIALLGVDWPLAFISGTLFRGGPIQGVFGSRGAMAFLSLVALFTFMIEVRTRSIRRSIGIASLVLAGVGMVLASSPIGFLAAAAVAVTGGAVYVLRRAAPRTRWRWNASFTALGVLGVFGIWLARYSIIVALDGRGETSTRVHVWQEMSRYLFYRPLNGWGFSGGWWVGAPYTWIQQAEGKTLGSGLNGFIDVYFQLGAIGLVLFLALVGTAFARSWMLAANRRSSIYIWPALLLATLIVSSLADSFVLSGAGLLLLVVASVKSARELTWGDAWRSRERTPLPSRAGR